MRRSFRNLTGLLFLFAVLLALAAAPAGALTGDQWTTVTSAAPWGPRVDHTSVVFNGKMWVMGGWDGVNAGYPKNDVWYSNDGVLWTAATSAAAWVPRLLHASVVFNNRIWVIGGQAGFGGDLVQNDVFWSSDGVAWTTATAHANWSPRISPAVVVFNNKMWLIGGHVPLYLFVYPPPHDELYPRQVHSSTDGITWTTETTAAAWPGRMRHSVVVHNNEMWLMGGTANELPQPDRGQFHDVWHSANGVTWTQATTATWAARANPGALVEDGKIWVVGGGFGLPIFEISGPNYNDVWYSTTGTSWTQATASARWSPRSDHTVLAFGGNLWVLGGFAQASSDPLDVVACSDVFYTGAAVVPPQARARSLWNAYR